MKFASPRKLLTTWIIYETRFVIRLFIRRVAGVKSELKVWEQNWFSLWITKKNGGDKHGIPGPAELKMQTGKSIKK